MRQRHHHRLQATGFTTVGEAAGAKEAPEATAIFDAVAEKKGKRKRSEAQEEGGVDEGH